VKRLSSRRRDVDFVDLEFLDSQHEPIR
jgi:hypothetical protein